MKKQHKIKQMTKQQKNTTSKQRNFACDLVRFRHDPDVASHQVTKRVAPFSAVKSSTAQIVLRPHLWKEWWEVIVAAAVAVNYNSTYYYLIVYLDIFRSCRRHRRSSSSSSSLKRAYTTPNGPHTPLKVGRIDSNRPSWHALQTNWSPRTLWVVPCTVRFASYQDP